jgi:hypothetical protein
MKNFDIKQESLRGRRILYTVSVYWKGAIRNVHLSESRIPDNIDCLCGVLVEKA